MNLAQRITIGVSLLLMGLTSYQYIVSNIGKRDYVPYLLFFAFVGGGLFILFGIKRLNLRYGIDKFNEHMEKKYGEKS